jgi:hypothetical protein
VALNPASAFWIASPSRSHLTGDSPGFGKIATLTCFGAGNGGTMLVTEDVVMSINQNPYEPPIVAQLVELPRVAKKRQPLLAVVFLIFDLPLTVGSTWIGWYIVQWHLRNDGRGDMPAMIAGCTILFVLAAFFWLALFLCLKELVQFARGR